MTAVVKVNYVKEVVEVQSQVEQVNTTDATTGQSLGAQPPSPICRLATRNFQQLLTLSAGASSDLNNAAQLGRGQVYIHVNGGREDNNNYLIDGITVADYAFGELTYTPLCPARMRSRNSKSAPAFTMPPRDATAAATLTPL
jgi:hypothetical protein